MVIIILKVYHISAQPYSLVAYFFLFHLSLVTALNII